MKKSHILGITLLAIWAITLIAFLGHYFIRLILPEYVSSIGLVASGLLFGVMGFLSLFNDTLDLSHKLFGSNSESQTKQLDRESINLYPHRNPPYNAVKMLYSGAEMVKDFEAHVIYKDVNGNKQSKEIQEFFPEQDPQMIWHYYKYDFLKPNQVAYFRLVKRKTAPDGRVGFNIISKHKNSQLAQNCVQLNEIDTLFTENISRVCDFRLNNLICSIRKPKLIRIVNITR